MACRPLAGRRRKRSGLLRNGPRPRLQRPAPRRFWPVQLGHAVKSPVSINKKLYGGRDAEVICSIARRHTI